jgi:diaminopimelate epimerase
MTRKTPFLKMHGTGNDFVVLDSRKHAVSLTKEAITHICDRHFGVGCDTLVMLEPSKSADVSVKFYNGDGSLSSTCGNASRCVADLVMRESGAREATLETIAGNLTATKNADGAITVNMGTPKWDWRDVPLSESRNTLHLGLEEGLLSDPVAVSMGNPHAVFFVRDLAHVKMAEWGAKLEHNKLFPERANISAVQIISPTHVKMLVWERGVGLTMACGSGACAAVVAAVRRGLTERKVTVELPGGNLTVDWQADVTNTTHGQVSMSGAVAYVFEGSIDI